MVAAGWATTTKSSWGWVIFSARAYGYFPTYALGNVMSVQIWERVRADLPDLDGQFEQGEFAPLRAWYYENLYRYGRKFTPQETLELASGSLLDARPYLRYLQAKYAVE